MKSLTPVPGPSWLARMPRHLLPIVLTPLALALVTHGGTSPADMPPLPAPAHVGSQHATPAPEADTRVGAARPSLPRSAPTRLLIPSIGVDAPFTDLAIGSSGRLDPPPPDATNLVGWFAAGPSPGELGTAVVAGHLDTKTMPAVFASLSTLLPGSAVNILRRDGATASFVVDTIDHFPQDKFPNDRVYADTPDAQLRLITCGGSYDHDKKRYNENTVVFAHLKTPATRKE
ncbi:class F sortase [Streptomyces sp. NPDC005551]|uniref:class F sortase n=1 Tax=Streptomyces sp. NPDC005551 TaxID=3364725 RepID=UPI0036AFE5F1